MLEIIKAARVPSANRPLNTLEYSEYTGNVTIAFIEGKGRGLIATEDINPGQLIFTSRALAIIYPEADSNSIITSPLLSKVKRFRLLKESVANLVKSSTESAKRIYSLSAGPKLGHLEIDSVNDPTKLKVDLKRIEGICKINGFQGDSCTSSGSGFGPFGLWYLTSFLNHDCFKCNANWVIYDDFMFVRSTKFVRKGQELLISYIDPDQPYAIRRESFLKHNFICQCELCLMEVQEGEEVRGTRDNILRKFKNYVEQEGPNGDPREIESFVQHLEKLRFSTELNPFPLQPLMHLGLVHFEQRSFTKAIEAFERGFKICKLFTQLLPAGTCLAFAVAECHLKLKQREELRQWVGEGKKCVRLQYGCKNDYEVWEIVKWLKPNFVHGFEQYLEMP